MGAWALFQNFYRIGTPPILPDEPSYTRNGWWYVHGLVHPPRVPFHSLIPVRGNFEHAPLAKYLFGLAQLIDGTPADLAASRCVSALATVLVGVAVAVWVARVVDPWTGLLAGGLLTLLPEPAVGTAGRYNRFAEFDSTASMFMVFSVVLAWEWGRRYGRASWAYAALTGVAVGLASGAKENGFLGAVGPVALILVLAVASRSRLILVRLGQTVMAIALALVVFVALYLPIGNPVTSIRYLLAFQSAQDSAGHLVGFAGRVSLFPPWWANLWYAGHNYGSTLTGFLVAAALCAVVLRRDLLVGWCVAALVAPFVFHCFIARVAQSGYWVMWTPMFLTLAAIGAAEVVKLALRAPRMAIPTALATGAAVLVVPLGSSIDQSVLVADLHPTGVKVLPALMRAHHLSGPVISTGVAGISYSYYLPGTTIYHHVSGSHTPGAQTIVVAKTQCRDPLDASVRALAGVNQALGRVQQIHRDSLITVYAVTGPLVMPTASQVKAEPPSRLIDGC